MNALGSPRGHWWALYCLGLLATTALSACRGCSRATTETPRLRLQPTATTELDARPSLPAPPAYAPAKAQRYRSVRGLQVWLFERHDLPLVAVALASPFGAAYDPPAQPGLAYLTGRLLTRDVRQPDSSTVAAALADTGAQLQTRIDTDGSVIAMRVLRENFASAFEAFTNLVARPRWRAAQFAELHAEWQNELRARDRQLDAVTRLVSNAVLYGPDSPYGHPLEGRLQNAPAMTLDALQAFHQQAYRLEHSVLIVVGDIGRNELDGAIAQHLAKWPPAALPALRARAAPSPVRERSKLVLVDCSAAGLDPDSYSTAVSLLLPTVPSSDSRVALLQLASRVLGGPLNTRLSVPTRGAHGWSAEAHTEVRSQRGYSAIAVRALARSRTTAAVVRKLTLQIDNLGHYGMTEAELEKARNQSLTDLLLRHDTAGPYSLRMAELSVLGLDPSIDGARSHRQLEASLAQVNRVAAAYFDLDHTSTVVVGPTTKLLAQLKALDLGEPQMWTTDGRPTSRP